MRVLRWLPSCLGLVVGLEALPARAQLELKNDGFVDMGIAAFEGGFVTGEIAASRFKPPPGMFKIQKIRFLWGPAGGLSDVTVRIWDDAASDTDPGLELSMGDFMVAGSDSVLQEIDLVPTGGVIVSGPFRVGLEFNMDAPPGVARDTDGTIMAGSNFIRAEGIGWDTSATFGVTGDWILRAIGTPVGAAESAPEPPPEPGPEAAAEPSLDAPVESAPESMADAGVDASEAPDAAMDGSEGCRGNAECGLGRYCGSNGVCTFDCHTDKDCGAKMTCSSLGKCVPGASDGGGACGCRTGAPSPDSSFPLDLSLLLLGLALMRRRSSHRR